MNFLKSLFKSDNKISDEFDSPMFVGTKAEFNKYFGPRLRNLVQYIARNHKSAIGKCQHCGVVKSKNLDAAHVHGKERSTMIDEVLQPFKFNDNYKVNLVEFEDHFVKLHDPIEEVILVLCKECHVKYDSNSKTNNIDVVAKPKEHTKSSYKSNSRSNSSQPRKGGRFNNTEIQVKVTEAALNISLDELDRLCNPAYSKNVFDSNYAIFVRVPINTKTDIKRKAIKDQLNNSRWTWKYEFERNGYSYAVSTQWYNRNDDGVQSWLRKFSK